MDVRRDLPMPSTTGPVVGHGIGEVLFHTVYRGRAYDKHFVPRSGPVIYAANHAGFMDGPLVFGLAPRVPHFIVKEEMFHGPIGWLLRTMGQIPINRTSADRQALMVARELLREGRAVGIFPEGRRGRGDVAEAHAGVAWLALGSGAPVVPVAILGTRRTGQSISGFPPPLRRVAVVFGEPLHLTAPEGMARRAAMTVVTEQLRTRLAEHVLSSSVRTNLPLPQDGAVEEVS